MDAPKGARRKGSRLHCDQVTRGRKVLKSSKSSKMDKNFADTRTTLRRSTSPTPHHGTRGTRTRAPSRWYAMMMIAKLDRCEHEKTKSTTQTLRSLRQEQGRQNSFIPKNERVRQRPLDEALRADLEWQSLNWKTSSSSSSRNWWQHEHQYFQWREHQDTQWRDHNWLKE